MYKIIYHLKVVKSDIPKLDQKSKNKIKKSIESKLIEHPELYSNHLRNTLNNYRKLRVGDYRVIFKIVKKEVRILIIGHRKDVYKLVLNRY